MKKFFLLLAVVSMAGFSAFAQTITLSGSNASGNAGDFFDIPITLTIGPNTIGSFNSVNALLGTPTTGANAGAAYFTITLNTIGSSFDNFNQSPPYAFNVAGDTANSGSTLTNRDVGASSSTGVTVAASGGSFLVDTLRFQSAANTPAGTYNFYASSGGANDPGNQGSYVATIDQNGETDYDINQTPLFTITIEATAVPEPSTWIAGFAAAGVIGYSMLRRRQTA
jgi:hypothetical protein